MNTKGMMVHAEEGGGGEGAAAESGEAGTGSLSQPTTGIVASHSE